jgi:hypothetical protein
MSTYVAGRATNLGVGEQALLVLGSLGDAPFTTPAVAVGRDSSGFDLVTVFNASSEDAIVEVSPSDTDDGFQPLTDAESSTAIKVVAGTSAVFRCIGPFARLSFAADPGTSGAVVLAR